MEAVKLTLVNGADKEGSLFALTSNKHTPTVKVPQLGSVFLELPSWMSPFLQFFFKLRDVEEK